MAIDIDENLLSLAEFVKLPTTVALNAINTDRFQRFTKKTPYIKVGTQLGTEFVPVYINIKNISKLIEELGSDYLLYPAILSPVGSQANDDAGITPIIEHPYLNLSGKGVIIGIIDTGIDYTKDVFKYEDNTSKIISIWDQTIEGESTDYTYYGSVYSREKINEAIKSENPFEIVPSTDTDGHGTFLASVAAGRKTDEFVGAAPGAELVIVKLRRAHQYFINELLLPPDKPNYYENTDYMLGMKYIFDAFEELNAPTVICIGMGSNSTGHDGNTMFEEYISFLSQRPGYAIVTAAGNESNARHHTKGLIPRTGSTDVIGIRVGETKASFQITIFGPAYDKISIGITSPTGEVISRIPYKVGLEAIEELTFEKTTISIKYYQDVNTVILLGFRDAKEGIWEITLYGDSILVGEYHAWLPITYQVSPEVEFMRPVPEYTIVYPATSFRSITCGAYDSEQNSLYVSSSWGPTRLPRMAPDFVAPGINVKGAYPTGYGILNGTSAAAAVTAGAAAILLQWGIIQGNLSSMDGDMVRILLMSGCKRDENVKYPNIRWGYGKLDLYGTFFEIRESSFKYDVSGGMRGSQ